MSNWFEKLLPLAVGATAGYLTMNPAVGMAAYGATNAMGSKSGDGALLGSQQPQQQQMVQGPTATSPFGTPMGGMPQVKSEMSLPQRTTPPTGPTKSERIQNSTPEDWAKYGGGALQAISAVQEYKQQQELMNAKIAASKFYNPTVVSGPSSPGAATHVGNFPTVGNGFQFYGGR